MADQNTGFNFKEWYERNGDKLNKDRRRRYDEDPEYRARVLEMNRKSRAVRQKEQAVDREKARDAREVNVRLKPWKTIEAKIGKKGKQATATLRTIGALAKALGVSVQAVRLWEKQKVLPPAPLRNEKGDRLYTQEYLDMATKVMRQQGRLDPDRLSQPAETKAFLATVQLGKKEIQVTMFRIGTLARAIRRTVVTLEQMEAKGYLPETPFRWGKKTRYRLYTADQMTAVRESLSARGGSIRGPENWKKFFDEVESTWERQGVYQAKLIHVKPLASS